MRVVLFGSGSPFSVAALEALAPAATVAAVVVPGAGPIRGPRSAVRALARRGAGRALVRAAAQYGIPVLRHRPGREVELVADLGRLEAELGCVATYPSLLASATLAVFPRGVLGVHPSLLPRHRGPAPLFWTYFHEDAFAGVTVHWLDAGEDQGDIVLQDKIPLARGRPGPDLYAEIARRGAALLARAVAEVEAGIAGRTAQDPSLATREPAPDRTEWTIDFATWGAERVWHFLRGVDGMHAALRDEKGRFVLHGPVRGYRLESPAARPGSIELVAGGWRLTCRDGVVELEADVQSTKTSSSGADRKA
jgi:methionyl-tRNA formyltransferase